MMCEVSDGRSVPEYRILDIKLIQYYYNIPFIICYIKSLTELSYSKHSDLDLPSSKQFKVNFT